MTQPFHLVTYLAMMGEKDEVIIRRLDPDNSKDKALMYQYKDVRPERTVKSINEGEL
jgi:hypothetical protein